MAVNGERVRGRGEIACGYVENSSSCCGLCGDVDGRDQRRLRGTAGGAAWKLTRAGGAGEAVAGAVVSGAAGIQRVLGVRMESLRADSGLSRGYPETSCVLDGALQAAVSACSAPEPAGMPACAGAAAAGWVRPRRFRSPCVRGNAAVRRLEIDPPRRRGDQPSQGRGQ